MYIESRFYNNGKAKIRQLIAYKGSGEGKTDDYVFYIEEVENLEEWMEDNLEIDLDDVAAFVLDLEDGKWIDITEYL